jgi:gliding motility-associated-like protein
LNLQAGNYSVWIQDAKGCKKNQTVVLNQPIGFSTIVDIQNIEGCNGDATGIIDFSINGNTSPYTYSWYYNEVPVNESTSSIYNLLSGNYDITVTDYNNCKMTYSYLITEPEGISLNTYPQFASCEEKNDGSITTTVIGGTSPYYYLWGSSETTVNGTTTGDIYNLSKGYYSLRVSDSKGCTLSKEDIFVDFDGLNGCIEIPSGFTPNNDNIHDEWKIYGLLDFPDVVVEIYNRWGQEIFSSQGYKNPWDGKYNGVDLPTAAYYYVIELNESDKVFNGTVTIKR